MWQLRVVLTSGLLLATMTPCVADDKKDPAPRSLAEDATLLAEGKGAVGWVSGKVTLTGRDKKKVTGTLEMRFTVEKGASGGNVALRANLDGGAGETVSSNAVPFKLEETDGKRYLHIYKADKIKDAKDPHMTLEYSFTSGELVMKGGAIDGWCFYYSGELPNPTTFKLSK